MINLIDRMELFENGALFYNQLKKKYKLSSRDMLVVLASEDNKVNECTLKYIPVMWKQRGLENIYVVASERVKSKCDSFKYGIEIDLLNERDIESLCLLYSVYRFSDQIIINTFTNTSDTDGTKLIGSCNITLEDIVSVAFLGLHSVPDEKTIGECLAEYYGKEHINNTCDTIDWSSFPNKILAYTEDYYDIDMTMQTAVKAIEKDGRITMDNKIVLFGATSASVYIMEKLEGYNYVAIVDNNPEKQGKMIKGVRVYSPQEYLSKHDDELRIIVASGYYKSMCEQLSSLGYKINEQVFVAYGVLGVMETDYRAVKYHEARAIKGHYFSEMLRKKYGNKKILLCPYPGTGDVYLIGLYLREYIKKERIKEYIFVVPSVSCKKIAELFGIDSVVIPKEDVWCYVEYGRMVGFDRADMVILNDSFYQICGGRLRGYKNLDFNTIFRRLLFDIETDKWKQTDAMPSLVGESAEEYFDENNLEPGKTILISPYANTTTKIGNDTWHRIVKILRQRGYHIVTNIGSDEEKPIEDTIGLFIPYKKLISFVNVAGGFIGLRSGLCDILSTTKSKMCVLYPEGSCFENSTMYEYFSLERMGLRQENLLELEFNSLNIEGFVDNICNYFCNS